ncbi:unnamed protein product [marine sediment metagenome]|uniref:Uncharacterized protein n=1 Tax=marine sediment metagenome TaxID=412755 RepID=X1FA07_9ZZZZ
MSGISFGNTGHVGSSDDLESKLSHLSEELERTFDRLGACIPVEVRSVEDLTNCIRDTEHFYLCPDHDLDHDQHHPTKLLG